MRLSRLIITIISFLWLATFFGILVINAQSTRNYLVEQMQSHAQDTATSLGLSLTTSIERNDLATMNSMADAIFDRGYYREIVVRNVTGDILLTRTQTTWVKDVPAWFTKTLELDTPRGKSLIMRGWKQFGTVEVVSHPGYAYKELWRVSLRAFWWILGIGIASFLLVIFALRFALAPLAKMEAQAVGISRRQFSVLNEMPWARELRRVAEAMNAMSTAVERMLDAQTALTEKMRAKAYQDELTGLANRRNFEERLNHLISTPEEFSGGTLLFVRLDGFKEYNDKNGRAAGDLLLQDAARLLGDFCSGHERGVPARTDGAEFALLIPDTTPDETSALGGAVIRALSRLQEQSGDRHGILTHIGIAYYQPGQSAEELLAAADTALRAAQNEASNAYRLHGSGDLTDIKVLSATRWKDVIESSLKTGDIVVQYQPVMGFHDKGELHFEALVRIATKDGALMHASVFTQTAKKLGLTQDLDRLVVEKVLQQMAQSGPQAAHKVAVNLFGSSVQNEGFVDWLCARLRENPEKTKRLIFEIAEYGLLDNIDALRTAIHRLRETGAGFAIDRFGHSAASVGYLKNLPLDYIKIDGSYTRHIDRDDDKQFFVQALVGIVHGLGMGAIAKYVETREELEVLKKLRVDGVQGFYIGKPR